MTVIIISYTGSQLIDPMILPFLDTTAKIIRTCVLIQYQHVFMFPV